MILDIIICLLIPLIGFKIINSFNFDSIQTKNLRWLWIYHFLFGLIFYYYIVSQGGSDATKYWETAKSLDRSNLWYLFFESKGTRAMYAINYIPSGIFDLTFFTGSLIYSLIGFYGMIIFYKITFDLIPYNSTFQGITLFPALFFLPNFHFWSAGVGKDTLVFTAIACIIYALMKIKKRFLMLGVGILFCFVIRPHIIAFLGLAYMMAYLIKKSTKVYIKIILLMALAGAGVILVPIVADYASIEELSVEGYEEFSERGVVKLSKAHTGSAVDVSSYPFPVKLFTFLYRPTFIDINSPPALIAAFENLLLLVLSAIVLKSRPVYTFKQSPFIIKFFLFFLFIGTIAFSLSLGNLGIMLRMRNMFLPGMIMYILWSFSIRQNNSIALRNT